MLVGQRDSRTSCLCGLLQKGTGDVGGSAWDSCVSLDGLRVGEREIAAAAGAGEDENQSSGT